MDEIKIIQERFEKNLKQIKKMVNMGSEVEEVLIGLIKGFKKYFEEAIAGKGMIPVRQKLEGVLKTVQGIKGRPELKGGYDILYNQAVVLMVANLESFMNDLFKGIINNYLYLIKWPENKKITIDTSLLEFSNSTNIGSLFVKSMDKENNFQDLGSTVRFLEKYLNIDVNFLNKKDKDRIIFFQAIRHVIIHNSSKIDDVFLRQVRDTEYKDKYCIDDDVVLTEADYLEAEKGFSEFSIKVLSSIIGRELDKMENEK